MRVLVTGGAGFIGSNFVRRALNGKYSAISNVIVLDSLTYAGNLKNLEPITENPNFKFIKGSINDRDLMGKLVNEVDAIINFAAESHVDRSISDTSKFLETNINGVFEILECMKNSNVRLIQVSTDEVYGSIASGSWDENSPILPNSPYSASKASAELLCRSYRNTFGIDFIITRCSNNYGPYHHPEKFIPKSITKLLEGKRIPIYGDGKNSRDWIHVDDHCDGIYSALINGESGEIYNFGGNNELTNLELTKIILNLLNCDENSIEFVPDRLGHDFRYSVDSNKSFTKLEFSPKVDFNQGIREVIDWYRENERWWKTLA